MVIPHTIHKPPSYSKISHSKKNKKRSSKASSQKKSQQVPQRRQSDFELDHAHHEEAEHDLDEEYDQEEEFEEEYSFDLPIIPFISHAERRHKALSKLLRLNAYEDDGDGSISKLFITIATIVDPMTQPMVKGHNCRAISFAKGCQIKFYSYLYTLFYFFFGSLD
ncbi:hypothetical protein WICANDRAFT_59996 [Wickerhamomyces anomalus NRRL Y-366-8]|uniref:Uncharacterized protein n=1 Tax=Wickerhamomyces anomalus (strain ATCC 58044 / CBS 1984 / NCYC 433 / NRRL Y-366-8) TaxID=683960 RepID=A0A1E3PAE8_WICAA|nr:uncharacterized protein WICANDRAFT_59996 [Wickerhamomyces anomalus NRRL Y-366-8]ODQ61922.1 hypothetical protein WICANDRAFT_59996 [Wickerhamomyces anomalus NRRL Y-366-8]